MKFNIFSMGASTLAVIALATSASAQSMGPGAFPGASTPKDATGSRIDSGAAMARTETPVSQLSWLPSISPHSDIPTLPQETDIAVGDVVQAVTDAPLVVGQNSMGVVPKGMLGRVLDISGTWVGVTVGANGQPYNGWVQRERLSRVTPRNLAGITGAGEPAAVAGRTTLMR